jgi:1-acyl-sn-glycerol-3-phosphate acyltransferase
MIATMIRLLTGVQARWVGAEPRVGPRIYFANHMSNLDLPVLWAALPMEIRRRVQPVAAKDYWSLTPLHRWMATSVFHAELIERKAVTRENNPLRQMEGIIDRGNALVIFPEGRRGTSDDGELLPFKPGMWHLARNRPDLELVPVWLDNLNRILPRGEWLPVPLMASVTFGTPLRLQEAEPKDVFLARCTAALASLADEDGPT